MRCVMVVYRCGNWGVRGSRTEPSFTASCCLGVCSWASQVLDCFLRGNYESEKGEWEGPSRFSSDPCMGNAKEK